MVYRAIRILAIEQYARIVIPFSIVILCVLNPFFFLYLVELVELFKVNNEKG
jgi:hypothetical protein